MTEIFRDWIFGMTGAALFCTVAMELTPRGPVRAVVGTLCGVVMAAALLSPLPQADLSAYSLNLARYRTGAESAVRAGETVSEEWNRVVIEERFRAYILDKAQRLGASVTDAHVTLRWSTEGLWYPVAAEITGEYHAQLSETIAAELGIPADAQNWGEDGKT